MEPDAYTVWDDNYAILNTPRGNKFPTFDGASTHTRGFN